MAVLWGHVNDTVPAASERNPSLPAAVDRVLRRALAKEPAQRYQTCRALIEDARDALGVPGVHLPPEPNRRRLTATVVAVVAVAAGGTLAGVLATRGGTPAAAATGGALVRIDPASDSAGRPLAVGAGPQTVAADGREVWVSSRRDASLWRIDATTGVPTRI